MRLGWALKEKYLASSIQHIVHHLLPICFTLFLKVRKHIWLETPLISYKMQTILVVLPWAFYFICFFIHPVMFCQIPKSPLQSVYRHFLSHNLSLSFPSSSLFLLAHCQERVPTTYSTTMCVYRIPYYPTTNMHSAPVQFQ
jgi:hypothetical protein